MAEGKIRVKFEPKGDKQLISAIKALRVETKKLAGANTVLTTETKKTNNEQKKQERRNRNLAGTFSVLRSKMLLAAFAVKQFADPFIAIARNSVMVAANFEALETRLVSMTGSTRIAAQMMAEFRDIAATTPFAVQDVVEAGVQLRAFGVDAQEMIKPVTDLAAFMGTTATEAASALGRAFAGGAGAADILRERGILQLIKDSQGIEDLSKITLPEFRQALQSALIDPTAGVVGATDKLAKTTIGAFSNMKDALDELQVTFATVSGLKDWMTGMAESTKELANSIDSATIERITKIGKLIIDLNNFRQTLGFLGGDLKDFPKRISELWETSITDAAEATEQARQNFEKLNSVMNLGNAIFSELSDVFTDIPIKEMNNDFIMTSIAVNEIGGSTKHNIPLIEQLGASLKTNAVITKEGADEMKNYIQNAISMGRSIDHVGKAASTAAQHFIVNKIQEGTASYIADFLKTTPLPVFISAPLAVAGGAAFGSLMQQTINSVAKFETGGMVGGRRHSQGGTMIEAEQGEFVMSRNAVSAIGVENLNRMNQGQSGGGGTIVINNPIVNSDFVENDFAELMREAVRRGADFGIS